MSTPRNQRSRNIGECIKKPIWIVEQWVNDSNYKHIIYQARTWSANSRLSSEHLFVCPGVVVSWRGGSVDISWWWSVLLLPVGGGEDDIDTSPTCILYCCQCSVHWSSASSCRQRISAWRSRPHICSYHHTSEHTPTHCSPWRFLPPRYCPRTGTRLARSCLTKE